MKSICEKTKERDNRGFTFVEILCAVAILGMVIAVIGSIMLFTSKTYTSGSKETSIQQELQVAVNHIAGIVQNSSDVKTVDNVVNFETSTGQHILTWTGSDTKQLKLEQKLEDGTSSGEQLLAENITAFTAKADDFETTKTVELSIQVTDKTDASKKYNMTYNMSARNGAVTTVAVGDLVPTATIVCDDYLVLVPGQEYTIPVEVRGVASGITVSKIGDAALEYMSVGAENKITVKVPLNADGDTVYRLKVETTEKDEALNPLSTRNIEIRVRRATGVSVACPGNTPGKAAVKDTVYRFVSTVTGTNFAKVLGAVEWENGFVDPRQAKWEVVSLTVGGIDRTSQLNSYFNFMGKNEEFTDTPPYIAYSLVNDVTEVTELIVKATALHPNGNNKAGIAYNNNNVFGTYKLTLTPPGAPVPDEPGVDNATIVIEPLEEKTVHMLNVAEEWTLTGNTDSNTVAACSEGNVNLKLGKDEKGTGGKLKYASASCKLDAYVRRVNNVKFSTQSALNIKKQNLTGTVMQLEAEATGTNLTHMPEYESEYINPYGLEWSVIPPGGEEISLEEYTDFIEDITYTNNESGMQSVSFKLKQPFLSRTILRATSKHAAGANKSGVQYADVYAELKVSITGDIVGGVSEVEFRRGRTNYSMFTNPNINETVKTLVEAYYWGKETNVQGRYFFRYKEEGKNWTQYFRFNDGSPVTVLMDNDESSLFHPLKNYEMDVMYIVYDPSTKEIFWPWNDITLTSGYGFKEDGFYLGEFAQYAKGEYGRTDDDSCVISQTIPVSDIYFTKDEKLGQYEDRSDYLGVHSFEQTPLQVKAWSQSNNNVQINIAADYIALVEDESHQIHYVVKAEKKDENGNWVDVSDAVLIGDNIHAWQLNTHAPSYTINSIYRADGLYRFGSSLDDWPYYTYNIVDTSGNPMLISPEYMFDTIPSQYKNLDAFDYDLYSWETGENVVYVEFQGYAADGGLALELDTVKTSGLADIATMKSGDYIDVKYTEGWASKGVLLLEAPSGDGSWIEVKPAETYTDASGKTHAKFSYESIVEAYGNTDLTNVKKAAMKASGSELLVNQVDLVISGATKNIW